MVRKKQGLFETILNMLVHTHIYVNPPLVPEIKLFSE